MARDRYHEHRPPEEDHDDRNLADSGTADTSDETQRGHQCWKFCDDEQPPYPTIQVNLSSAEGWTTIRPKVDTGFNGSLAIDNEAVKKLHLAAVGTILIRTATGHSEAPIYAVNLHQLELGIDYTTLAIGAQRSLVGRTLLKNREWLLDFRKRRFCLITAPP